MIGKAFKAEFRRYFLSVREKPLLVVNPLVFYLLITLLFPLGLSPKMSLLHALAPGLIWIMLLLSMMMPIERLFQQDFDSGILEQYLLGQTSLYFVVQARVLAFWCFNTLPLVLLSPFIALMLQMNWHESLVLLVSLLTGSPVVLMLMALLSALTMGLAGRQILLPILLLPLIVPVVILGGGSVSLTMQALSATPMLLLLSAVCSFVISTVPFAISSAIRMVEF